jgi:hypothetical protein
MEEWRSLDDREKLDDLPCEKQLFCASLRRFRIVQRCKMRSSSAKYFDFLCIRSP